MFFFFFFFDENESVVSIFLVVFKLFIVAKWEHRSLASDLLVTKLKLFREKVRRRERIISTLRKILMGGLLRKPTMSFRRVEVIRFFFIENDMRKWHFYKKKLVPKSAKRWRLFLLIYQVWLQDIGKMSPEIFIFYHFERNSYNPLWTSATQLSL